MLPEKNCDFVTDKNDYENPWDELRNVEFAGKDMVDTAIHLPNTSDNETCGFYLRSIERMGRMEDVRDFLKDAVNRSYMNLTEAESQELLNEYKVELSSRLSLDQKEALKAYSGYNYKLINQVLRGYWNYDELGAQTPEKMEFAEEKIGEIEQAIMQAPSLEEDFVTYRGVGMGTFRDYGVHNLGELKRLDGEFFLEEGFCSTSLNKNKSFTNVDFDDTYREKCQVEIKYHIPRESKDYVGLLSSDLSYSEQQDEILLNRNSLSYVTKVEVDEEAQKAQMEMILIPLQIYDPQP